MSCISGTIYIFVIVDQPGRVEADKFWHLTSGKQDVLLLTVEYFDYLGFSIVNDTNRPIETKLVGVNMGENMEQILKIYVFRG